MPTHEEIEAAKAHMKEVDSAQEIILEAMFDDLRSEYDNSFLNNEDDLGKEKA